MTVCTCQRTDGATFYCTFICWPWLPLIERTTKFDHIYNWMHIAKAKGFRIFGYAIMPNHVERGDVSATPVEHYQLAWGT